MTMPTMPLLPARARHVVFGSFSTKIATESPILTTSFFVPSCCFSWFLSCSMSPGGYSKPDTCGFNCFLNCSTSSRALLSGLLDLTDLSAKASAASRLDTFAAAAKASLSAAAFAAAASCVCSYKSSSTRVKRSVDDRASSMATSARRFCFCSWHSSSSNLDASSAWPFWAVIAPC